jgi:2,5-diketo-D-gluconate reductase A
VWLESGGRHIDTAFVYGDAQQALVGAAVATSGISREELFITTKVMCCPTDRCSQFCVEPPNPVNASVTNVREQLEHSLGLLRLKYADLVLLHFPCSSFEDTAAAYAVLEEAHAQGLARAIGVSNLNASALAALLEVAKVRPAVNQNAFSIAGHPAAHDGEGTTCLEGSRLYGADDGSFEFGTKHGVKLAAYSP